MKKGDVSYRFFFFNKNFNNFKIDYISLKLLNLKINQVNIIRTQLRVC